MIAHVLFSTSISLCSPLLRHSSCHSLNHHGLTIALPLCTEGSEMETLCGGHVNMCWRDHQHLWIRDYRCVVCVCVCVFWKVTTFWSILTSFMAAWRLRLISLRFQVVQGLGLGMLLWSIKLLSSITVQIHAFLWATSLCFSLCWCSKKVPSMISCI